MATKPLIYNKKATFNYEVLEQYEAGIELFGFEVKSIKGGQGSLEGSYAVLKDGEMYLKNAFIPPFQEKNTPENYEPRRLRKLLFKKSELSSFQDKKKSEGLTLIPISLYNKAGKVKVSIALAKGKKKFDKREDIKRRDQERDTGRRLK